MTRIWCWLGFHQWVPRWRRHWPYSGSYDRYDECRRCGERRRR